MPDKRTVVRSLKFTEAEERAIARAAKSAGVVWSVYAREAILRHAAPDSSQASRTRQITRNGK